MGGGGLGVRQKVITASLKHHWRLHVQFLWEKSRDVFKLNPSPPTSCCYFFSDQQRIAAYPFSFEPFKIVLL